MKTNKFISPFISCVVQNFPFIEESIDGLTQYQLLCKIVEKLNAVITQTNTQTENIEKLEEAFTTLKNYVDNYFNNLDVQTEINNKLDEMATSGELEAIIASYLNTQAVRGFSTLNDLKNATGLITGAICQTSGKTTYKDGFGSLYRIRNITNEDIVDNDNLVAITSDVSLVAEKITNNISNTKTTGTTNTYSCDYINGIVESGSNENGNWIKYNDGTMICTKRIEPSEFGDVQSYKVVYTTWTYPQEFISTEGLTTYVTPRNWSQYMNLTKTANPTKSTIQIMLACINLNPLEVITDKAWMYGVNAMAIGKWK